MGFLRPQSITDDEAWLDYFVKELRALQEDLGGASPLGDDASLKDLARFYLTYARDLIDERKYADVPEPAPRVLRRTGGAGVAGRQEFAGGARGGTGSWRSRAGCAELPWIRLCVRPDQLTFAAQRA